MPEVICALGNAKSVCPNVSELVETNSADPMLRTGNYLCTFRNGRARSQHWIRGIRLNSAHQNVGSADAQITSCTVKVRRGCYVPKKGTPQSEIFCAKHRQSLQSAPSAVPLGTQCLCVLTKTRFRLVGNHGRCALSTG